jgi:hypothetical protein
MDSADLSTTNTLITSLIPRNNIKRLVLKPAGQSSPHCFGKYDLVPGTLLSYPIA